MSSNLYYGVKEADNKNSFFQAQWLTSYELLNRLNIKNLNSYNLNHALDKLIYPNELVLSESQSVTDLLLFAKYTDKYGNLKLKSILLSQLICSILKHTSYQSSSNSESNIFDIFILSLPKDSYFWCDLNDAQIIPKYALRVGYDQYVRQFSYIGRMKVAYLFTNNSNVNQPNSLPQFAFNLTHKILIGTLMHLYEYIPAICLKLHDLSYLDEKKLFSCNPSQNYQPLNIQQYHEYFNHSLNDSFWFKLKSAFKSNSLKEVDFNLIAKNYEVLCLKKQPASLKQLCKLVLIKLEEDTFKFDCFNVENIRKNKEINTFLREKLPNSINNLLWPSFLEPGECITKHGKMRSSNGIFELSIDKNGTLRFIKLIKQVYKKTFYKTDEKDFVCKEFTQIVTYEKNVESLLVSKSGVYLIYDNRQETRKPTLFYKHNATQNFESSISFKPCYNLIDDRTINHFNNLFDKTSYLVELSNDGYLRVIIQANLKTSSSKPIFINLLSLDDYFTYLKDDQDVISSNSHETGLTESITVSELTKNVANIESNRLIKIKFIAKLCELKILPIKLINLVKNFIKIIYEYIIFRYTAIAH
jgi:hypothetical protein